MHCLIQTDPLPVKKGHGSVRAHVLQSIWRTDQRGHAMKTSAMLHTSMGLAIEIGGPALLVSPAHRLLGDAQALPTRLLDQLILWGLFGAIIGLVVLWERIRLTTGAHPHFGEGEEILNIQKTTPYTVEIDRKMRAYPRT